MNAVVEAFNTRELLKIRVLDAAPENAGATGREIAQQLEGAEVIQVVGHVFVLYRPFPEHPDIRLPA